MVEVRTKVDAHFGQKRFLKKIAHKAIDFSRRGNYACAWLLYMLLDEQHRSALRRACAGVIVLFPSA
jgi:hypothetical protein